VDRAIHGYSRVEKYEQVIQQVISAAEVISWFVSEVSRFMVRVRVYSVPGNHSRIFPDKEQNQCRGVFWKAINVLVDSKWAKFDKIEFGDNKIGDSIGRFCVRKKLVYAVHGDKDSVSSVVQNLTMMTGMKPDIVLMGHRHTNGLTTVYEIEVVEGGWCEWTVTFCMGKRFRNQSEQTVIFIGDKGVDCAYDVTLN